jgi:hypothetical protein
MANLVQKLRDSKMFFILLFLIPAVAAFIGLEWTFLNVFFVIATQIILAHAIYAGYRVLKQQEKMNFIQYLLLGTIWIMMLVLFSDWQTPRGWLLSLILILGVGILFNLYTKNISKQYHIKEFCKGKTYVDFVGLALGLCGVVFVKISQHYFILGVLNLLIIIAINYIVFFKIRLFDKLEGV